MQLCASLWGGSVGANGAKDFAVPAAGDRPKRGGFAYACLATGRMTSRSEYEAAGAGIGAAWRETLGRNFPPSTLLYIEGLVDIRAKVEIEVTAFVPAA
jgi:hypothetical protein